MTTNKDELIEQLKITFEPNVLINTAMAQEIITLVESHIISRQDMVNNDLISREEVIDALEQAQYEGHTGYLTAEQAIKAIEDM